MKLLKSLRSGRTKDFSALLFGLCDADAVFDFTLIHLSPEKILVRFLYKRVYIFVLFIV